MAGALSSATAGRLSVGDSAVKLGIVCAEVLMVLKWKLKANEMMSQVGRVVNVMLYVQSSFTARISITIQSRELAQMRFTWKSIIRRLVIVGFGTSSRCIILHKLFVNS